MPTPSGGSVTTAPAMLTAPPLGWIRPAMQRSSVVFPQPDGPTTDTISAGPTSKVMPDSTVRSPYRLLS
jgi:hypothetical protein